MRCYNISDMNCEEKLILLDGCWDDYSRFKQLCCVDTVPFCRGVCWTLGILDEGGECWEDADAGFIGYDWSYRHNSIRETALPEYAALPRISRYKWMNQNLRQLSRVMIRPKHRGMGYAYWLVANTLPMVGIRFIECVTFTASIAHILEKAGFIRFGIAGEQACDYYLWTNPARHNAGI